MSEIGLNGKPLADVPFGTVVAAGQRIAEAATELASRLKPKSADDKLTELMASDPLVGDSVAPSTAARQSVVVEPRSAVDHFEPMLSHFVFSYLPVPLRLASEPFYVLAHRMCDQLPRSAERTVMLRKLLEAKDCAVRCAVAMEGL